MVVTAASYELLISPNVYITGSQWDRARSGPLDFYVARGSSFRPTEWMLERDPPVIAFMYWVVVVTHTRFLDTVYFHQLNPPPDPPSIGPSGVLYRMETGFGVGPLPADYSVNETRIFDAEGIYANCPPTFSPQTEDNHLITASFRYSTILNGAFTSLYDVPEVYFIGSDDCPGSITPPEGGTLTQPTLTTRPNKVTVGMNTTFHDVAYLSGGSRPTGNITFRLYRNDSLIVREDVVGVSGNGYYASPDADTSVYGPGSYRYTAHYSGDVRNKGADTTINDPDEQVIIVSRSALGYRDVLLRLHLRKYEHKDPPIRFNLSPVHPGVSRNPQGGGPRAWYTRTGA